MITKGLLIAKRGRTANFDAHPLFAHFTGPDAARVAELEQEVQSQLRSPETISLRLLGCGEVTIAVAYPTASPHLACKRMPPADSEDDAQRYMRRPDEAGVNCVPTAFYTAPCANGGVALYLCQPILSPDLLGPAVLRARTPTHPTKSLLLS